jgi:small subunit ribosomal protein S6
MPFYENVFIARQDVSSARVDSLIQTFSTLLEEQGGKVTKQEYWGLRSLAYRIKKNRKGHYVLLNIDAPSTAVQEMERNMRLSEDVLRYLTVRMDELEQEPSVVMRGRGAREERPYGRREGGDKERPPRTERTESVASKEDGAPEPAPAAAEPVIEEPPVTDKAAEQTAPVETTGSPESKEPAPKGDDA